MLESKQKSKKTILNDIFLMLKEYYDFNDKSDVQRFFSRLHSSENAKKLSDIETDIYAFYDENSEYQKNNQEEIKYLMKEYSEEDTYIHFLVHAYSLKYDIDINVLYSHMLEIFKKKNFKKNF